VKELLDLAQTREEYILIATLCACPSALTFGSLYDGSAKCWLLCRLTDFRSLPRSVDTYSEDTLCSLTGQTSHNRT
jgi:hypothetical protein